MVKSSKEIALETIRKLMKSDMNVSKECALKLIVALSPLLEASEAVIIELYTPMFTSDSPQIRILASKYLYVRKAII